MTGPQFFETGMGQTFYGGTMPRLIEAIKGLADILDTHKEDLSEYQHQLVIRGTAGDELADLTFMDDMAKVELKEELIKRVQLIEQLRAHRDALLNQLAINHPPSPDTGVVQSGK
jgi:hypothetical protein